MGGPHETPLAMGQVSLMEMLQSQQSECPTAAMSSLLPLPRDAPDCPEGLQELPRLERGGFCKGWRICHLLLGPSHSFRAQATCKQIWDRS